MTYWRISSSTNQNLLSAFEAGRWGSNRKSEIGNLKTGDELVFYCSLDGERGGYSAIGVVTHELFVEHERLWLDDLYPLRVRFKLTLGPLEARVHRESVKAELGGARLRHLRQASIIPLTDEEYQAIARVMREAVANALRVAD